MTSLAVSLLSFGLSATCIAYARITHRTSQFNIATCTHTSLYHH